MSSAVAPDTESGPAGSGPSSQEQAHNINHDHGVRRHSSGSPASDTAQPGTQNSSQSPQRANSGLNGPADKQGLTNGVLHTNEQTDSQSSTQHVAAGDLTSIGAQFVSQENGQHRAPSARQYREHSIRIRRRREPSARQHRELSTRQRREPSARQRRESFARQYREPSATQHQEPSIPQHRVPSPHQNHDPSSRNSSDTREP